MSRPASFFMMHLVLSSVHSVDVLGFRMLLFAACYPILVCEVILIYAGDCLFVLVKSREDCVVGHRTPIERSVVRVLPCWKSLLKEVPCYVFSVV